MRYPKEISCPYCGGTGDGPGADCGFCEDGMLTVTRPFVDVKTVDGIREHFRKERNSK